MPELPEVETIVRQLRPALEGRPIASLEILDPRWSGRLDPAALSGLVRGRVIRRLWRRGKYLVWELDGEVHLLMHLRMTGTLLLDPPVDPLHIRVVLSLDGPRVVFVDPRRFGTGELVVGVGELERFFAARLGVEPLEDEFTPQLLRAVARNRRGPVKPFLLDQRNVAGVGNIYADEALFRARIHPLRPAGALTPKQYAGLHAGVIASLEAGIDARGASIDDFRHPDGVRGSFQDRFLVHRREGLPCPVCGTPIRKLVVAGRGTYVCERCQPRPRPRHKRALQSGRMPTSGGDQLEQTAGLVGGTNLVVSAKELLVDDDLREGHHSRLIDELVPRARIV
ncbi:MAG: formamidopyrimidine-DNA glycosylase [Solirubrobacteraceae bacterium]|jgi:formamidopyrimidine-DNA glycosylase|nr:formamidopyrimidine-DNA glycosylase [Solirubrobacteraceae bacterium]